MKEFYKSKTLQKLSYLFIIMCTSLLIFSSCKKEEEEEFTDHMVRFEVKATEGSIVKTIVTQIGTKQQTYFDLTTTPSAPFLWVSQTTFVNSSKSQLNLDANATLPNESAQLILNIYIDEVVKKTITITGAGYKSASLDYSFLSN